jgi:hypothetical protein
MRDRKRLRRRSYLPATFGVGVQSQDRIGE